MAFYSGRRLNDLGSFDLCNSLETAHYALISPLLIPGTSVGLCIPKICNKQEFIDFMFSDLNDL
jgi:hypothetical protein